MKALLGAVVAVYCVLWFAAGCTAWGQNGGRKCHTGYNPVTHLCVDQPDMRKCSGWSPPGFCWESSQGERDDQG